MRKSLFDINVSRKGAYSRKGSYSRGRFGTRTLKIVRAGILRFEPIESDTGPIMKYSKRVFA